MGIEILTSGHFDEAELSANGEVLATSQGQASEDFLSFLYKEQSINYPKFHKMDLLCKVGTVLSELLIRDLSPDQKEQLENMAIVLNSSTSSLHTDIAHQKTLEEDQSSPAIFVYTLPNIIIGEICIKHKIYGENMFLVSDEPDVETLRDYTESIFESGKAEQCLVGWVDALSDKWSVSIAIVKRTGKEHTGNSLEEIFSEAKSILNN